MSFFLGCVFGPAEVADKLCRTVRAMHGRVKGTGAGGLVYDADNPQIFRWNYASLAWALVSSSTRMCSIEDWATVGNLLEAGIVYLF